MFITISNGTYLKKKSINMLNIKTSVRFNVFNDNETRWGTVIKKNMEYDDFNEYNSNRKIILNISYYLR